MSKSPDAFRTISEVADWLGVQAHVLRFWESRFSQVKPVKRAGGRRYYRPNDMRLLGGIKKLLHDDGITIKGVQRILREQGVGHVSSLSQGLDETSAFQPVVDETVVPFSPKPVSADSGQFDMDLHVPPAQKANGTGAASESNDHPAEETPELEEISTAPLFGGIASQAWQTTDFDDEVLRKIEPIAKDLRAWLNRVENRPAG